MKQILFIFLAIFVNLTAFSQSDKQVKSQKVVIKTSAECEECKERIESKLNYTKGISFAELDYKTQELTVKFKSDKITLEEIKKIVSDLGYNADDVKANPEEQKKLPSCCLPGGMK